MIYTVTDKLKPLNPLEPLKLEEVQFIILHHAEAARYSWEQCNADHKANGWNCAGYNEFISKSGDVFIMRGDCVGAQCLGYNSVSYGICCEGNYMTEKNMPDTQFKALVDRVRYHKKRFVNFIETVPHKRFVDTDCPGTYFPFDKVLQTVKDEEDFENDVEILKREGIINSPDYWIQNAVSGKLVSGDYVRILIKNIAHHLNEV